MVEESKRKIDRVVVRFRCSKIMEDKKVQIAEKDFNFLMYQATENAVKNRCAAAICDGRMIEKYAPNLTDETVRALMSMLQGTISSKENAIYREAAKKSIKILKDEMGYRIC